MADEELTNAQGDPAAEAQPDQTGATPPGTQGDPAASDNVAGEDLLKALKAERVTVAGLQKELKRRDAVADKQQKAQLEQAGEYRQLYEKATADLEIEKQNADRLARMEATMEASVQRRVEALDERFRSLVPDGYTAEQKTEWLDTNEALLTAPTAPNFNAGAGAGIPGSNPLRNVDPAQIEGARIMGVDEEGIKRAMQELTSEDQLGPQNGDRQERGNLQQNAAGMFMPQMQFPTLPNRENTTATAEVQQPASTHRTRRKS